MKNHKTHHTFRLGLFGGTFNPIHIGHRQAALEVLTQFNLSRIYFIPSALPPHKSKGALATAADRLEMVRLAIADHPQLSVSDVELQRPGFSYTIDTIEHFRTEVKAGDRIYFILGVDAFLEINSWKSFRSLLKQSSLIVMSRPQAGTTADRLDSDVASFVRQKISPAYQWNPSRSALVHDCYQPIYPAHITPVDIASSRLRRMLREGMDIMPWISPAVAQYIFQKDLYQ